ncbi:hypothetical protein ACRTEC_04755 [Janibacter indicus]
MTTGGERDDHLVELAAGRGGLVACALALLITTCLPMTRWEGEGEETTGLLQEDVAPPVLDLDLWGLSGAGDVSGLLIAVPLVLLAVLCLAARGSSLLKLLPAIAGVVTLWSGVHAALGGFEGDLLAARWLCVLVPAVTTYVAVRVHLAEGRVYG